MGTYVLNRLQITHMNYLGKHSKNLDEKNRIVIPASYRYTLGKEVYLSNEFDSALVLRSKKDADKWISKIKNLSDFKKEQRALKRELFSSMVRLEIDDKGRISIPKELLLSSKISKGKVVILGVGDKIEIYDESIWKKEISKPPISIEEIAEKIEDINEA